ncbi:MAG: dihydropteroate synthase [Planctomycetota bacterium]
MAILNVTPDSFADGGRLPTPEHALAAAQTALRHGADLLDIGGESTRPGADRIDADEQIARVVPAICAIRRAGIEAPISIDTTRAAVARAALDAGADAINDVAAGTEDASMLGLAAERACGLILMHRAAPPQRDRYSDAYSAEPAYPAGVVEAVRTFLRARLDAALAAGVRADALLLDPGLGFGKSVKQNLELIRATGELLTLGRPVLSALSRKSFVGRVSLGRDSEPAERLGGTLSLSALHLASGARVFRVHDPGAAGQAIRAAWACLADGAGGAGGFGGIVCPRPGVSPLQPGA